MSLLDQVLSASPAGGTVRLVPLEDVCPDKDNFYELSELERLAASIRTFGLEQPLVVRLDPEAPGKYRLISGHRRRAALLMLSEQEPERWAEVEVRVVETMGETVDRLRLIHNNRTARDKTEWERMMEAAELMEIAKRLKAEGAEVSGKMRDLVAEDMSLSSAQIAKYLVIHKRLVPVLMGRYRAGSLGTQVAYACAGLDPAQQESLAASGEELTLAAVQARLAESRRVKAQEAADKRAAPDGARPESAAAPEVAETTPEKPERAPVKEERAPVECEVAPPVAETAPEKAQSAQIEAEKVLPDREQRPRSRMTWGDRLRAMDDDRLAHNLVQREFCPRSICPNSEMQCEPCVLAWLGSISDE